jgi:rubrerythrin
MGRKPVNTYKLLWNTDAVNRNKVTKMTNSDISAIEEEWFSRRHTILSNAGILLAYDSRLMKAAILLASAAMADKYKIRIISKDKTPTEDILTSIKYIYKQEQLTDTIEALLEKEKLTKPVLEDLVKSVSNKEIKKMLLKLEDTVTSELEFKYIVEELITRINLERIMFDGCFNSVKFGDSFYEIVYDTNSILSVESLPLDKMLPNITDKGIITQWLYCNEEKAQAFRLYPYQVLHFTFLPDNYIGLGLFSSTMNVNSITRKIESYMMLARKTRSVQTRLHYPNFSNLPENIKEQQSIPSDTEVSAYKQKVITAIKSNSGASLDFFSNGLWDIKNIPSDGTNFNYVGDVDYFNELFKIGLIVPTGLIDSGESVNRATMDVQIKFLKGLFSLLKNERKLNTEQLVTMELILNGYEPNSFYVEVTNDNTGLIDTLEASQIVARLNNKYNNFPMPVLASLLGIEWEEIVEGYELQQASGIDTAPKS